MTEDIAYWDRVADKSIDIDKMLVRFNSDKGRAILHYLSEFPMLNKKILEIGFGRGIIAHSIRTVCRKFDYYTTDLSFTFCHWARGLMFRSTQARIDFLPFKSNLFDYVWIFDVLEHIDPQIRDSAFKEIGRVLKERDSVVMLNNPCSKSYHTHFDWGFTQRDIGSLADSIGGVLNTVNAYSVGDDISQFISIVR